jgi:lipopolysaccharide biosynthesis protein
MLAAEYPMAIVGSCLAVCIDPVRQVVDGSDPNGDSRRYAVYVIYDRRGQVADYVVAQAEALARIGYKVVIVSTSPRLPNSQASKLIPFCWKIIHRWNIGHDFGSYKAGIHQMDSLREAESLILMNDSCYGPLFDLGGIEQKACDNGADIWGITDSWWKAYHVQSYYIRLNDRVISSDAFRRFWITLLPYQSRNLVIRFGEIRLTQHLLRSGMTAAVLCPYEAVSERALELILARISGDGIGLLPSERIYLEELAETISRGSKLNPTHPFWDVLIMEYGCPFIKRNLLRSNPQGIRGIIDWPLLIAKHTRYDVSLIHRHLKIR